MFTPQITLRFFTIIFHGEFTLSADPRFSHGQGTTFLKPGRSSATAASKTCKARRYFIVYGGESTIDLYGGFHSHGGSLKWMVYNGKSHLNRWFRGSPISGNFHIFNGHFRNRLIGDTIYKAYFSRPCEGMHTQNMALYGTVPPV